MYIDDAIEIKKPAPDSHFLLKQCKVCKGDNVAYVKYMAGQKEMYRVSCFDCGHTVKSGTAFCAHDAQIAWNSREVASA